MCVVDALIRGNLLLPRTYGGIRTLGADAVLEAANTKDDFSVTDLTTELHICEGEVAQKFAHAMRSAHTPKHVTPDFNPDNRADLAVLSSQELEKETMLDFFGHHFDTVLHSLGEGFDVLHRAIPELDQSDVDERATQPILMQIVGAIRDALLDQDMRTVIKDYHEEVSKPENPVLTPAYEVADAWKDVFFQKYIPNLDVKGIDRDSLEELFDIFTDPTSLQRNDSVGIV